MLSPDSQFEGSMKIRIWDFLPRFLVLAIILATAALCAAGCSHSDASQKPTTLAAQDAALHVNPPPSYVAAYLAGHHITAQTGPATYQAQQAAAAAQYATKNSNAAPPSTAP